MRIRIVVLAAVVVLTLGASIASATSMATSVLNICNSALTCPNTFGKMDINLFSSTMATITFTANPGFLFIDSSVVDVNVNALSWTVSGLTATQLSGLGFAPFALSNTGAGNVDGFGILNQTFKNFDGFDHAVKTVTFTLTNTSGTWASALNVLTMNSPHTFFDAAHIAVCNVASCLQSGGATVTGFAAENTLTSTTPPPVPEPATLFLFGTVLSAAALVGKRLLNA